MSPWPEGEKTVGGGEKKLQGEEMVSAKALGWKCAGWGFLEWRGPSGQCTDIR